MGFAYTPGLTVAENTVIRKVRRLPLKGEVLVKVGQTVNADDVVAQTELPGEVKPINVASKLGCNAEEVAEIMLKGEGDVINKDEVFAETKGLFGKWFKSRATSPIDGKIESISRVTGQVIIRGKPTLLQKSAFAKGTIVDIQNEESATVEIHGTYIQGIFGIGGEVTGPLEVVVSTPNQILDDSLITEAHADKIIVGGSLITAKAVKKAISVGVKGIIAGGLNDADLREFLGYELGVAITGEETLGISVIVTEGFGEIAMADATFALFQKRQGLSTSINGATQIRAGVIRPEVIVPVEGERAAAAIDDEESSILKVGTRLRAIREPFFGRLGKCTDLPVELVRLSSETKVRVLEVEFDNGQRAIVPRANVELIKQ